MRYFFLILLPMLGCSKAQEFKSTDSVAKLSKAIAGISNKAIAGDAEKPVPGASALQRKIIYTADVDLVVEDFDAIPSEVKKLADRFGGYIAGSNVSGSPGSPRSGEWTIRVPVERFDEFLAAAQQLGEVRSVRTNSQDVSEEYYDIESRLRNKKLAEQRLLKHLTDSTQELKDTLEVERELSRVREQIEQMEGRLKRLENLTSLTTVNLNVEEIKDYVPEEMASYGTRLRRSFSASTNNLWEGTQNVSIGVIAGLPWLGVFGVPVLGLWTFVRARRKRPR